MGYWNHNFKDDNLNEFAKPSLREKVVYSVVEGGSASVWYFLVITFSTFFYTDVIGLSAATIGTIVLVSRCFDGVSDFIVGVLIDRTQSEKGRTRVWVFWTSIPYATMLIVLYCVPPWSTTSQIIFVIITYNLAVTVSYTLNNIPWNTLGAVMTRNGQERDKLMAIRIAGSNFGNALVTALALPIVNAVGGVENQRAWIVTALIFAMICYSLNLLAVFCIKERVKPDPVSRKNAKYDIPATLMNVYFWAAIGIVAAYNVFQVATMTFMPYYATYVLGDTMFTSIITPIQGAFIAIACLFCAYLQRRGFKKGQLIKYGAIIALAAQIVFAIFPTNIPVLYITTLLRGFGFGFTGATMFAFAPDAIEYGHWRTGHRAEGTTTSGSLIGNKIGVLVGSGVCTVLLGMSGYDGTVSVQSESAINMINLVFIYSPMLMAGVLIVISFLHKMDKKYDSIMDDLENGRFHPNAKYAAPADKTAS